ncbi:family 16 glycosylhydrolase [Treponema sp.]|uniref:family 16 glycosylhydrolase n=1 Tax=Treponema sp. TaxID=166 RepID=UPI00298EB01D|nr:family 16 glycosylhydrolase [Treponema sp.]MCR5613016.1 family 16 glycosylhydrolase [Treponema sp.]
MIKRVKNIFLMMCSVFVMNNLFADALKNSTYTEEDLVWVENFDGDKVNSEDWNFEFHEPGWVNHELQSYGDSAQNTYVKDGMLVIQPLKNGSKYTSGRINTQGKHEFMYGRMEARLKVPKGKGFLPAFWMMPADESFYGQWPKCGEIDIMEVLGDQINKVYGTLHFGEPHTQKQGTYSLKKGNFADEFHVFAVEWEPAEMRFYVDGIMFYKVSDWFTKKPGKKEEPYPAPYNQKFYIILNVAVGGDWPGNPDASTKFGQNAQMVVDYVKVYQKKKYDTKVSKPNGSNVKQDKGVNLIPAEGNWSLYAGEKGKGSVEFEGDVIKVITQNAGDKDYSIQLSQSAIALVKGNNYRFSFDAYAEDARKIVTAISGPDNNYVRYLADKPISLTKKKQTFSFTFQMSGKTDENARIEFNMGNMGSTATVYISNVKLEKM